jgi:hypothetical protein
MIDDLTQPISDPLMLRRARDGRATAGTPDDYDVLSEGRAIGRIFRSASAPQDRPWMWTITGAVVSPRLPSHGFAETLDEAQRPPLPRRGANGSRFKIATDCRVSFAPPLLRRTGLRPAQKRPG